MRIGCFQPKYMLVRQPKVKSLNLNAVLTFKLLITISLLSCSTTNYLSSSMDKNMLISHWQPSLMGLDVAVTNSLCHSLNGNKKNQGLIISAWNCARAVSSKMEDIKLFIENYRPHLFAILETDLHGQHPFLGRRIPFTTDEINDKLKVDGYSIVLPDTWHLFNQARMIVYVSDNISFKNRNIPNTVNFLPNITLAVGIG